MFRIGYIIFIFGLFQVVFAQTKTDTLIAKQKRYSLHLQATLLSQYHFDFTSAYTGDNSLLNSEPVASSVSATLFLNYKLGKKTYFVFNPEMAGGKGLSKTLGIAGFPNGEVYRVGDPKPKPFIGRLYFEQRIALSEDKMQVDEDINQVAELTNKDYISFIAGKFSLTDFFDDSQISHDPRTQFFNWALMGNGGWDYPANTRGYTMGAVVQALYKDFCLRTALTTVPVEANGPELQFKWAKAMGFVIEFEKTHLFQKSEKQFTTVHTGYFINLAHMGNYQESIAKGTVLVQAPNILDSRQYGRSKWGFYASADNNFGPYHFFLKASINDGKNETWAFTEIDKSFTFGFQWDGDLWKRNQDRFAIAYVRNNLSADHKSYLEKGGYGFLIGDGKLNYGSEQIIEAYYSMHLTKQIFLSPDYQFVINPAYNKDRGPVHIIGLRLHAEF
jgi:high affinity Mn2+ porin